MGQRKTLLGAVGLFLLLSVAFQNCGKLNQSPASNLSSASSANTSGSTATGTGGNGQESIVVTLSPPTPSVQVGSSLNLTATAVDSAGNPITYAWTLNGNPIGTNSSTLAMNSVPASDNGATIAVTASSPTVGVSAHATVSIVVSNASSSPSTVCNLTQGLNTLPVNGVTSYPYVTYGPSVPVSSFNLTGKTIVIVNLAVSGTAGLQVCTQDCEAVHAFACNYELGANGGYCYIYLQQIPLASGQDPSFYSGACSTH